MFKFTRAFNVQLNTVKFGNFKGLEHGILFKESLNATLIDLTIKSLKTKSSPILF